MTHARLSWRAHSGALIRLGLPIVGSLLAGFFIHVTDTVMMGWYGVDELAAIVLGGTFWFITFILGSGFGNALPAVVAAARARGDERQVRRAMRMTIWLTLIYSVVIAPVFLFAERILLAMGQTAEVAGLAADYLAIAGWSVVPFLLSNVIRSFLSALGRPSAVLVVTLVGFVLHAGLNVVLIFGYLGFPALGIRGAAISTLVSDTTILAIATAYMLRVFPQYELMARFWRPDPEMMARLFRLGWPIGLQLLAEVGLFAGAAVMMGWVGPEMLAAHGIAIQLASSTFLVHLGLANAATIRAGEAAGVGDPILLRDGAVVAVIMSVGFALVSMAVFLSFPAQLVALFLDPADPETPAVIAAGVQLVMIAALFQLFDGGQAMVIGLLRGLQDTRVPMFVAGVGYWLVGLPMSYTLGFVLGWGGVGVWTGLVAGLVVVWAWLSWRFWLTPVRQVGPAEALAG